MSLLFLVLFMLITNLAYGDAVEPSDLPQSYINEKSKVLLVDQKSREVMGTLYQINQRMKNMSKRRDIMNNKVMYIEGNVKNLARSAAELELLIKTQRQHLSKRLRAIYKLGDEGVARVIFSSASAQDLDQSLKYLKIISEYDYESIKNFEKNLLVLVKKRERLRKEVKNLIVAKERLKKQEEVLTHDQEQKSKLLDGLKSDRKKFLQNIASLRSRAEDFHIENLMDLSFFEKKGGLSSPVKGRINMDFGLIENETFQYRLSHKGLLFAVGPGSEVKSIFNGIIAFVGQVDGYGDTVVVDHGDHYYSVYARLGRVLVREGQKIIQSDVIAKSDHNLYFEIRHFSDAIDPKPWMKDI